MSHALLLGVDVGTTQTKVGVFDPGGELIASSHAGYALTIDQRTNAAEQNPVDWWSATTQTIREIMTKVDLKSVLAVSVGGQGPTVVALDEKLDPVYPALTWMDLRATKEAEELGKRSGVKLPPHFFIPKTMWLKANRPEAYAAARWFCQSWDFVAAKLLGELVISSSPGIAPWTDDLIEAADLDPSKFPTPNLMGSQLGKLSAQAANTIGLPEGIPVIGGISDFFEGLIGSGTLTNGLAVDNGGTSQGFSVCWDAPLEGEGLLKAPSFIGGHWYIGGPVSTTGKALDWWLTSILECEPGDYSILEDAADIPVGSENLIFLPYLAGERAPIWNPNARGVFFGLSLGHTRDHLTRAILESVAYALLQMIEIFEGAGGKVVEIRACGGQARSELWSRIKADVTGRPVLVPQITDAPMLGAAIIAGVGVGTFNDYSEGAEQMMRTRIVLEPNPEHHSKYQELFGLYRDLYPQIISSYERLNSIK
jgi:xylulokinase